MIASLPRESGRNANGFIRELLAAWSCGLLFGTSLFLPIVYLVGLVAVAAYSFGSFSPDFGLLFLILGLGVAAMFLGTALMGAFLAHSRRGMRSALVAVPLGAIALWIVWLLDGLYRISPSLLLAVTAAVAIMPVILMNTNAFPRRVQGLATGLAVGLGLSIVSGLALGRNILAGDNVFHFVWQVPSLVWVSAIYFLELAKDQAKTRWREFLVWAALVLASFGFPFLAIRAFCINC